MLEQVLTLLPYLLAQAQENNDVALYWGSDWTGY